MNKDLNFQYLCWKVNEGWDKKKIPTTAEYLERRDYELRIIGEMNFGDYFLIIEDIMSWAKNNGIPAGPGRGSGAGSIVCYALDITTIDPIRFGLFFERFLNPSRISMPDLDLDFCTERRGEIVKYLEKKYGSERVANIITFGRMWPRLAIRDVAKALKIPNYIQESDRIAKLFPSLEHDFEKAVDKSELLQQERKKYPELFRMAAKLSGKPRNVGVHAAGVIVTPDPLTDYFPLFYGSKAKRSNYASITQWDMYDMEETGFLKIDLLGLKTLTIMDKTVKRINKNNPEINLHLEDIELEDPGAIKLFAEGRTTGLFQLERRYVQDFCRNMGITSFIDVAALNALIRPGTMDSGMTEEFIARKKGEKDIEYPHECLRDALAETYGIIVYQEDAMRVAQVFAGFTLAEADNLRKAIGKKIPEKMEQAKKLFIKSAVERKGREKKEAEDIFYYIEKFAKYGFNKSHAVAYGKITLQSAYLKVYHPTEFMCELLNGEASNNLDSKIGTYIDEARSMGIDVRRPSALTSGAMFEMRGPKAIEFGLSFIKNVSPKAAKEIMKAREHCNSFVELLLNTNMTVLKANAVKSMINVGVFDHIDTDRDILHAKYEIAKNAVGKYKKQQQRKKQGTKLRVESTLEELREVESENVSKMNERTLEETIKDEFLECGAYLTCSPMLPFRDEISDKTNTDVADLADGYYSKASRLCIAGVLNSMREHVTKRGKSAGKEMAFLNISHNEKDMECVVFAEAYENLKEMLHDGKVYLFHGEMKNRSMIINNVELLSTI